MRQLLIAIGVLVLSSSTAAAQSDDPQPPDEVLLVGQTQVASSLGVTTDRLTLTTSTPTQWPDSSLGCPQPGMAYSQIVTPGWLLTFDIDDGTSQVEVHTDGGSRAVVC